MPDPLAIEDVARQAFDGDRNGCYTSLRNRPVSAERIKTITILMAIVR